jgi:hypothetical protein
MICRDLLFDYFIEAILTRWPNLLINRHPLVRIFVKADMREKILQAFTEGCREVVRTRSPSTLDAPGRVAAFQRRPPVDVVH